MSREKPKRLGKSEKARKSLVISEHAQLLKSQALFSGFGPKEAWASI
jgi:hypothetical protein